MLTTKDIAALLGITRGRVQALILKKRLPATKIGRDWMVAEKDFAEFTPRGPGKPKNTGKENSNGIL